MATENSGYKAYAKLLKVTDDGTSRALDVNGDLCSESGLAQDFKNNTPSDPDYFPPVLDTTMCPVTPLPDLFSISSSVSSGGVGTLDIVGGQPFEIIGLDFAVTADVDFVDLNFTDPVIVGIINPANLTRSGEMELNSLGSGTSTYTFNPSVNLSSCLVTVTTRSSGFGSGIGDDTNII